MSEEYKIKVLWVDDEPNDDFMNEAYEEGLDLDNVICVEDGIAKLKNPSASYDAIILDGNCRVKHDLNEVPSLDALREAIDELLRMNTSIPWFVYTAANYKGSDYLKFMISKRSYDDRLFYVKPVDRYDMYDNIKKAVSDMPTVTIKKKYFNALRVYSSPELIQLLIAFESGEISNDTSAPNIIRKILERVSVYLNDKGVLPVKFTGSNLNECSVCLGMMRDFIPTYIQRSFYHCEDLSNQGSHAYGETDKLIREGKAPYLNMSLVIDLLNILHWCGTISDDTEVLKQKSLRSYTSNRSITHVGKVVKENGILTLDGIVVSAADKSLKEGDFAACVDGAGNRKKKYVRLAYI